MKINDRINETICFYMNTALAHGREKAVHTRRVSEHDEKAAYSAPVPKCHGERR